MFFHVVTEIIIDCSEFIPNHTHVFSNWEIQIITVTYGTGFQYLNANPRKSVEK